MAHLAINEENMEKFKALKRKICFISNKDLNRDEVFDLMCEICNEKDVFKTKEKL